MCNVGGRSMSVCACAWKFRVLMTQRVGTGTSVQHEMGWPGLEKFLFISREDLCKSWNVCALI